ncbi:Uncharacterised protein, partial [Metamycoplasma alkalescens]
MRFKNSDESFFKIKIFDNELLLPFGYIKAASAPTKYRKVKNGAELEFNGVSDINTKFEHNMKHKIGDVYEITQIGYYDNGDEIVAHVMPNIVNGGRITSYLPKEITSLQGMFFQNW